VICINNNHSCCKCLQKLQKPGKRKINSCCISNPGKLKWKNCNKKCNNIQAGQILEKARRDISTEQEAAMKAMEGKVAELAMDAASRIMGKKNDEAQDMSLYDQFLEGAGDPHDRDVH